MINGFVYASREGGRLARLEARQNTDAAGYPTMLVPARVTAANADGSYKVVTYSDSGEVDQAHDYAVPVPAADLEVDQVVWLVQWPGNPVPVILVAGGGGSGCAVLASEIGPLF